MSQTVWDRADTVAGFLASPPNPVLLAWADKQATQRPLRILDIGCGAGRNAVPLALRGHEVSGVDPSEPMLEAGRHRAANAGLEGFDLRRGSMENLEWDDATFDLVVAHGVWNLATSDRQLFKAVAEASRVARPGAGLFVFTFSRSTLGASVAPVEGERFVFTRFSGSPQIFLTNAELDTLLAEGGFERPGPLTEYNRPGLVPSDGCAPRPVLWEGVWLRKPTLV